MTRKTKLMRKKVLHIITGLEVGGAETNLARVMPRLEENFENRICCLIGRGLMRKKFEKNNIPVYYLDIKGLFDFFNPFVILRFKKIIKEFKPDIIETYLIHSDLFGRIWGRFFSIKKIICNHRGSLLQWKWLAFFDRITSFLVTKYVFQTPSAQKEILRKFNLKKDKTEVVPNVINLDDFEFTIDKNEKLKELGIKSEGINIVSVSNLRIGKGQKYLIEAFEKIYKEGYKNINLLIIGDGDQKGALENQANSCFSKNKIYFLGKRSDVLEILKIGDIFVLPTFYEGMSNAIMEAMASGLGIITTDIDVNKDLIENNYSGILVPVKNSQKISEGLEKLIKDPEERKSLGENAYQEIKEKYSLDIVYQKIATLIESL